MAKKSQKQTVDNRALQNAIRVKMDRIEKDFYATYEREARNILMAIAEEGVKKVKEYIKKYFYSDTPTSAYYERLAEQGGFLATISYTILKDDNGVPSQVRIYCDWDKLKRVIRPYSPGQTPQFDAHNGFDNKKFTEGLYDYIMDGKWNSPYGHALTAGIGDEVNEELSRLLTGRAQKKITALMKEYFKDTNLKHRVSGAEGKPKLFATKDAKRHKK